MKIVLGSKSPRRQELFKLLGYQFVIHPSNADENSSETDPIKWVKKIAKRKAEALGLTFNDSLIITADTIVLHKGEILGKPKDKTEAFAMIKSLQNDTHNVYTAIVCLYKDEYTEFIEGTKVFVTKMSDEEILAYVETDEPYDKAGGYGIQGLFGKYIEKIEGDFYNVMGLPLCKLNKVLNKIKKTH